MKLYVDDIRTPPDGWTVCRNAKLAIMILGLGDVREISLDHDLGEHSDTGYDVLCWIEEKSDTDANFIPPAIHIHTANPVGRHKMNLARHRILLSLRNKALDPGQKL